MTNSLLMLVAITLTFSAANVHAVNEQRQPSPDLEWSDRPWMIRYVLFVDTVHGMSIGTQVARRRNLAPEKPGKPRIYLNAQEMFEPTATYSVPGQDPLALVLIQFDAAGHATSKSQLINQFTAKRSMIDTLVLIRTDPPKEKPYSFADWFPGIPGDVTFSPAVCDATDDLRYDDDWDRDSYVGSFGCREWTAQLYNDELPYINVTSYAKHGNFIGEFVGWSRFKDPLKPVIGLQGKTWLCLYDCPAGESPGIIPNVKAWTAKHHFPMPERPPKQPLYPNSDYKDDLND